MPTYENTVGNFCWVLYAAVPTAALWPLLERADQECARFTATLIREELIRRFPHGLVVQGDA